MDKKPQDIPQKELSAAERGLPPPPPPPPSFTTSSQKVILDSRAGGDVSQSPQQQPPVPSEDLLFGGQEATPEQLAAANRALFGDRASVAAPDLRQILQNSPLSSRSSDLEENSRDSLTAELGDRASQSSSNRESFDETEPGLGSHPVSTKGQAVLAELLPPSTEQALAARVEKRQHLFEQPSQPSDFSKQVPPQSPSQQRSFSPASGSTDHPLFDQAAKKQKDKENIDSLWERPTAEYSAQTRPIETNSGATAVSRVRVAGPLPLGDPNESTAQPKPSAAPRSREYKAEDFVEDGYDADAERDGREKAEASTSVSPSGSAPPSAMPSSAASSPGSSMTLSAPPLPPCEKLPELISLNLDLIEKVKHTPVTCPPEVTLKGDTAEVQVHKKGDLFYSKMLFEIQLVKHQLGLYLEQEYKNVAPIKEHALDEKQAKLEARKLAVDMHGTALKDMSATGPASSVPSMTPAAPAPSASTPLSVTASADTPKDMKATGPKAVEFSSSDVRLGGHQNEIAEAFAKLLEMFLLLLLNAHPIQQRQKIRALANEINDMRNQLAQLDKDHPLPTGTPSRVETFEKTIPPTLLKYLDSKVKEPEMGPDGNPLPKATLASLRKEFYEGEGKANADGVRSVKIDPKGLDFETIKAVCTKSEAATAFQDPIAEKRADRKEMDAALATRNKSLSTLESSITKIEAQNAALEEKAKTKHSKGLKPS